MKAAILEKYNKNGADLVIKDIEIPEPKENEVLVKVYASAVNPLDNMIIKKEVKLIVNYNTPLIMGNEFAGVVEKVGNKVTKYKQGDRVYARMPLSKTGTFAEYLTIEENEIHPSIDQIYSLEEINEALRKIASGGSQGKTIITVHTKS